MFVKSAGGGQQSRSDSLVVKLKADGYLHTAV